MAQKEIAVKVENLTKTFHIPLEAHSGLKQKLINTLKGRKGYREFTPLNGVSFEIEKGDFFGIVGRNGSGKSTLLKTIAGIYSPTGGAVHVNGSLIPFIELGVGFNPELTGRENVFLNGALLGFSRKEMEAMYDEIVEFAEIHDFMEERLKNYSSGMQVRLAFSIAIKAQSDILLLDEVLAVGDEAFQRKCYGYFEDLKRNNKTVILVTHDMGAVERFCNRAMLVEAGEIVEFGEPKVVAHAYTRLFAPVQETDEEEEVEEEVDTSNDTSNRWGTKQLQFTKVKVAPSDEKIYVDLTIKCNKPITGKTLVAYTVKTKDRRSLFGTSAEILDVDTLTAGDKVTYRLSFDNIVSHGDYYLDLSLRMARKESYLDFWIDAIGFSVDSGEYNGLNVLVDTSLERITNGKA